MSPTSHIPTAANVLRWLSYHGLSLFHFSMSSRAVLFDIFGTSFFTVSYSW
jgi:hypothetical protein